MSLPPHAFSNHPPQQKVVSLYSFVFRALRICSASSALNSEIKYFKSSSLARGYNPSFIDNAQSKFNNPKCVPSVSSNVSVFNSIVLPFYSLLCLKIYKLLSRFNFKGIFNTVLKNGIISSEIS